MSVMPYILKRKLIAGMLGLVVIVSCFLIPVAVLSGGSGASHSSDLDDSMSSNIADESPAVAPAPADTDTSQSMNLNTLNLTNDVGQGSVVVPASADTGENQSMKPMLLEDFESGWSLRLNSYGHFDYDPLILHEGSASVKITKFAGQAYTGVEKYVNLNLVDKDLYIWVRIGGGVTHLYCYVMAPNWNNSYNCNLTLRNNESLEDTWYRMPLHIASAAAVHNTPDLSQVAKLIFEVHGSTDVAVSAWVDDMRCYPAPSQGKVTLRFDDGEVSVYKTALPILTQHGFTGVAGVITNWVDNKAIHMSLEQLQQLQQMGWDIVSHSKFHSLNNGLGSADHDDMELRESQEFLLQNGFDEGSRFFIAPGGRVDAVLMETIKKYYSMASFSYPLINNAYPDPYVTGAFYVAQDTPVADIKTMIDKANEYGLWLILMFHAINDSGEPYTYSTADFAEVIDYLDAVDIPVVTFSDMLDNEQFQAMQSYFHDASQMAFSANAN